MSDWWICAERKHIGTLSSHTDPTSTGKMFRFAAPHFAAWQRLGITLATETPRFGQLAVNIGANWLGMKRAQQLAG